MSEPARITLRNGEVRQAMLNQLGAGGARVALSQRLRPGDMLRIDFNTGIGARHSLTAMVVYAMKDERGYQWLCGLCFVEVEPRGDVRIGEFIEEEERRRRVGFAMPKT
jgi:hypothetical protein